MAKDSDSKVTAKSYCASPVQSPGTLCDEKVLLETVVRTARLPWEGTMSLVWWNWGHGDEGENYRADAG